jgi:hypothetical protein
MAIISGANSYTWFNNLSACVNKCNSSGVYKLKCLTCEQMYVGQTGGSFRSRYEEHINDIRHNKGKSLYAQHILQHNHEYGLIDNTGYIKSGK